MRASGKHVFVNPADFHSKLIVAQIFTFWYSKKLPSKIFCSPLPMNGLTGVIFFKYSLVFVLFKFSLSIFIFVIILLPKLWYLLIPMRKRREERRYLLIISFQRRIGKNFLYLNTYIYRSVEFYCNHSFRS